MTTARNVHSSVVSFGARRGVLILGPSGSGKSTLALTMIEAGAQLVADDQAMVFAKNEALYARTPLSITGLIEARGVGILKVTHRHLAQIVLIVDMGLPRGPRMPTPDTREIDGVALPCLPGGTDPGFVQAVCALVQGSVRAER